MGPRLFGVTGREVSVVTSAGRRLRILRTELLLQLRVGNQFGDEIPALWDTGADFFTISEQFADEQGIEWQSATEQLGSGGTGGSLGGVFIPLVLRLRAVRDVVFRVDCQVLLGSDFPRPLLGNWFVRRNFDVETRGERRTYFRLRDPAPDAVPAGRPGGP
jgi:hypothetical protein